jgi:transcriptional regulator with XRE-family HTH domain
MEPISPSRTSYRFSPTKLTGLRNAQHLTTTQLAVLVNRSFYAVSSWERGVVVPPTKVLADLAQVLHASPADFFIEEVEDEVMLV